MNGCSAQAEQIQPKKREHIFLTMSMKLTFKRGFQEMQQVTYSGCLVLSKAKLFT